MAEGGKQSTRNYRKSCLSLGNKYATQSLYTSLNPQQPNHHLLRLDQIRRRQVGWQQPQPDLEQQLLEPLLPLTRLPVA
jgi:hypothetical protein